MQATHNTWIHDAEQTRKSDSTNTPEPNKEEQKLAVRRFIYSEEIEAPSWEEIRAQQAIEKGKRPLLEISYPEILPTWLDHEG